MLIKLRLAGTTNYGAILRHLILDATLVPDLFYIQAFKIVSRRILKNPQSKLRQCCKQVIENVSLDCFVIRPGLIITEDIYLDRESVLGRLKMPDEKRHVLMYFGMVFQVSYGL